MRFQSLGQGLFGFWTKGIRPRHHRARTRAGRVESALERLEPRTLLSATPASLEAGHYHTPEDLVVCPPPQITRAAARTLAPAATSTFDLADTFFLNSDPTAAHTIYLDFDGHTTSGTSWRLGGTFYSRAYSFEGTSASFTNAERLRIQRIWLRVVEDFAPFDVNVTTQDPGVERLQQWGAGDTQWGVRVVITPDNSWRPNAGGVAFMRSFADPADTPAFVFNKGEDGVAEAISHEVGHTLGLSHDGPGWNGYYNGHGSGATSWAPIMGVAYSTQISQWSKGEYPGANQKQDDLDMITNPSGSTWQGLTYRTDDHSDDFSGSTTLAADGANFVGTGLIEQSSDQDTFAFTTRSGRITIDVSPWMRRPNLDVWVGLYDAAGRLLQTANPVAALDASITRLLMAGTYYVRVDGVGKPAEGSDYGYSDYGSLGQYTLRVGRAPTQEDAYEENDFLTVAADPRGNGGLWEGQLLSTIDSYGVAADEDWYQISVPNRDKFIIAKLSFARQEGDLTLQVVDRRGRVIATATADDGGQVRAKLSYGGTYYLRVLPDPVHPGIVYDLSWTSVRKPLRVLPDYRGSGARAEAIGRDLVQVTGKWDDPPSNISDGAQAANSRKLPRGGDVDNERNRLDGNLDVEERKAIGKRRLASNVWADVNGDGIIDIADALLSSSRDRWKP